MKPGCLVLLAGDSRRMGRPKQHVMLAGRCFLDHILERLRAVREWLGTVIMIGREGDDAGRQRAVDFGALWVENPHPEDGPLSSIRCGLCRLPGDVGFLLWPIDHPLPGVPIVRSLLQQAEMTPDRIVVPSIGGRRGHPSHFPVWSRVELEAAPLDAGARWVLQQHPERIIHVETEDIWVRENLNTPESLARAELLLSTRADSEKAPCVPAGPTVK